MSNIGKICLALTLLFMGLILAVATNTYSSSGATFVITRLAPAEHIIYSGPIMDLGDQNQPTPAEYAQPAQTAALGEGQTPEAQHLFEPLHLSPKTLNTTAILLFGLGIAGIASIYRKGSNLE